MFTLLMCFAKNGVPKDNETVPWRKTEKEAPTIMRCVATVLAAELFA